MTTLVKKIKPIAMGLVIAALAIGFSAYTNTISEDFLWYELDQFGNVLNPDQGTSEPLSICKENEEAYCAVAFDIEDVEANDDQAPLSNVDMNPNHELIKDIMYRPE